MLLGRDELGVKRTWGRGGGVGERSGSSVRILRVLEALGGSSICILRGWRGSGGVGCLTDLSQPNSPGGSAKEIPHVRVWGGGVGFDECIEDSGSARLNPSYSTRV